MNGQLAGLLPHAAARAALLLLLLVAAPPAAFAQAREAQPHRPPPEPSYDPVRRPPGIRERQLQMEEMSREMNKGARPLKSEELRMAEIAEDYRDLQQVNNKMMAAVMRAAAPDYKLITGSAADIRRRAERLRENLALPAPEAEAKPEPKPVEDAAGMKAALLALDRSIMSFVRSPLFKNTDVLDAAAAARASRDLADVIERSRLAGAAAERLGKKGKN